LKKDPYGTQILRMPKPKEKSTATTRSMTKKLIQRGAMRLALLLLLLSLLVMVPVLRALPFPMLSLHASSTRAVASVHATSYINQMIADNYLAPACALPASTCTLGPAGASLTQLRYDVASNKCTASSATGACTGPIPTGISLLQSLTVLSFLYTGVSGSFPTQLGKLTNLINLSIVGGFTVIPNKFTGTLPTELG
jgi:hypothetical protein